MGGASLYYMIYARKHFRGPNVTTKEDERIGGEEEEKEQ